LTTAARKPYILKLVAFSAVLLALVYGLRSALPVAVDPRAEWLLLFFTLLTFLSLRIVETFSAPGTASFSTVYFGTMLFRLFLSVVAASLFILTQRENVLVFAANFMVFYLLYLGFEIYTLFSNLRQRFKGGAPDES
jgi:hypothetical protein